MPKGHKSDVARLVREQMCIGPRNPDTPWKSERPHEWEDKIYRGDGKPLKYTDGKPELPDYMKGAIPRGDGLLPVGHHFTQFE